MVPFVLAEFAGFNREEIGDFLSVHYAADMAGRLAVPLVAYRGGYSPKVMYAISLIGSSVGRTGLCFCICQFCAKFRLFCQDNERAIN